MVTLIAILIYAILGAVSIYVAVNKFKQEHYFLFGVWLMLAVESVLYMAKAILIE